VRSADPCTDDHAEDIVVAAGRLLALIDEQLAGVQIETGGAAR
jgi:hypothetical protein